jgi:type IV secretion system protein VirB10
VAEEKTPEAAEENPPGALSEETLFETSPEEATRFEEVSARAGFFNRKRVLLALCAGFALIVGGGLLMNISGGREKESAGAGAPSAAARAPADFLRTQRDRALAGGQEEEESSPVPPPEIPEASPASLPAAYSGGRDASRPAAPASPQPAPSARAAANPLLSAYRSPLSPAVEGSLFAEGRQQAASRAEQYPYRNPQEEARAAADSYLALAARQPASAAAGVPAAPDAYAAQNNQQEKQAFYNPASGGAEISGAFLGEYSLWPGSVVPGVLLTGITTDLPGEVLARVTANIYDSRTGLHLLIPQGSVLIARYNSSVSYAQQRVQIAWDTLIRPDGFRLNLGGSNGVDPQGSSGQPAEYHENWFEYLKAAGLISVFSVANARMTEEAAKLASSETAAAVAQANLEYVNQMSGGIIGRAMNIQPTLTVDPGTRINIFLNAPLLLPPARDSPASDRYIRE